MANPISIIKNVLKTVLENEEHQLKIIKSLGVLHNRHLEQAAKEINNLWDAEYSVFSQWGEDGILNFLCSSLQIQRPNYLDFGAGDVRYSNGRWLLESKGGAAVFVDARRDLYSSLQKSGLLVSCDVTAIRSYLTYENAPTVYSDALTRLGGSIDVFSIDLDGQDYWILESIAELDAKIIVLEFQAYLGHEIAVTVPRSLTFDRTKAHFSWIYYGASLLAFTDLLTERGYSLVGTNRQRGNAFFVRTDLFKSSELVRLSVPSVQELCDSQGGESRDESGKFVGLQGNDRCELVSNLSWFDCRTGSLKKLGTP